MGAILQDLLAVRDALGLCWLGNLGWLLRAGERLVAFDLDRPCKGAKVRVRSSAAPIDVVEAAQHRPRADRAIRESGTSQGRLKAGTPVRALSVVVRDILGQDRAQVPLVKGDHVVETL